MTVQVQVDINNDLYLSKWHYFSPLRNLNDLVNDAPHSLPVFCIGAGVKYSILLPPLYCVIIASAIKA